MMLQLQIFYCFEQFGEYNEQRRLKNRERGSHDLLPCAISEFVGETEENDGETRGRIKRCLEGEGDVQK